MTLLEALESLRRSLADKHMPLLSKPLLSAHIRLEKRFEAAWLMLKRLLLAMELSRKPMYATRCQVICNTLFARSKLTDERYILDLKHFKLSDFVLAFTPLIYETEEYQNQQLEALGYDSDISTIDTSQLETLPKLKQFIQEISWQQMLQSVDNYLAATQRFEKEVQKELTSK
ncbi:hypothetical protein HDV05_001364 [Chytridiales sp. JEL 0842]|nr:hypothetical protein HDV05_001364 [Chytridiales sp. JEL 0842]